MRRIPVLVLLSLLILLAACAQEEDPAPSPVAPAPVTPAAATSNPSALPPDTTLTPGPPTAVPVTVVAAVTPSSGSAGEKLRQPLWPQFLRELDFGIAAGNSYGPHALAYHPGLGHVYARTQPAGASMAESGWVTVLDVTSGQVLARIETGPDRYAEGRLALDPVRNLLYALNPSDASATVLDVQDLAMVDSLENLVALTVDSGAGRLYTGGGASLRILDASSREILRETALLPGQTPRLLAAGATAGRLYVVLETAAGHILSLFDLDTLDLLVSSTLPGRVDDLLVDPRQNSLYLTLNDGEHNLLWKVDSYGTLLEESVLGTWSQRTYLALDPEGARLFLVYDAYDHSRVSVIDLHTGEEERSISLDESPAAAVWAAPEGRLLVSQPYANLIRAVDPEGRQVDGLHPTALDLVDVALDTSQGRVYVTDSTGRLHVLDSDTDQEITVLPAAGQIAVDSPHGRFYTGGEGADRVRIFDAEPLAQIGEIRTKAKPVADAFHGGLYLVDRGVFVASLETLTITGVISDTLPQNTGYSPNPTAVDAMVDPGSGRVYATINNGVPGSNAGTYLYVYEPDTYQKVLTDTERSPNYLAIDPVTGRAYVSRIHLAGRSTSLLAGGRRYTARLEGVYGALQVDPQLGLVYLTTGHNGQSQMLILDARNLDVLNSVPVTGTLAALDPERHWLYLTANGSKLQIWSATGGQPPPPLTAPVSQPPDQFAHVFAPVTGSPLIAQDETYALYRSDDGGQSWNQVGGGLPADWLADVVFSPTFAQDQTLFAAVATADRGLGIWRSVDGGRSWRAANKGLNDMAISQLAISPAYATDGTLFATARKGGVYRSTTRGESWEPLTERYRPEGAVGESPGDLVLSPTYTEDQTLFLNHYGLQRSTGGEQWKQVLRHTVESIALSPAFAQDDTLYVWTRRGGLLRSRDGGDTWAAASAGLSLLGYGWGEVLLSPDFERDQTLYFIWTTSQPDRPLQVFRSIDAATSWQRLAGDLPQGAKTVELATDGSALEFHNETEPTERLPLAGLNWQDSGLPPVNEISFDRLVFSPQFETDRTLWALSEGVGILGSEDTGQTWSDTGFPAREATGRLDLAVTPPEQWYAGTSIGLYRSGPNEPWVRVEGGLPAGADTGTPKVVAGGGLRVLVGGPSPAVFVSTDGGTTWTQPIPDLPDGALAQDLVLSPALETDRTAFISILGQDLLRTIDGGPWQEAAPPVDWTSSALQISPLFDRDGLVFVRLDDRWLWRSQDGGETWSDVTGPWGEQAPLTVEPGPMPHLVPVTFSPTYAQDGVILTQAGTRLYRSTDQGTTWRTVYEGDPWHMQVIFSGGEVFLWQGRAISRSDDAGLTWQALPLAPWSESDAGQLLFSPNFAQDRTLLAWAATGQVYLSPDAGRSWREASSGLPPSGARQVTFSPSYAMDGAIYLIPTGPGLYRWTDRNVWLPVTEKIPVSPPATPVSPPTPAATPIFCAIESVFWPGQTAGDTPLGCPQQEAESLMLAEQQFEHGAMIWDSDTRQIYVMENGNRWQVFADTWTPEQPEIDPGLVPPADRIQPKRGFGRVWREQLGGTEAGIGWAITEERPVDGWRQRFDYGMLFWTAPPQGTAYLLYEGGNWEAIPVPGP